MPTTRRQRHSLMALAHTANAVAAQERRRVALLETARELSRRRRVQPSYELALRHRHVPLLRTIPENAPNHGTRNAQNRRIHTLHMLYSNLQQPHHPKAIRNNARYAANLTTAQALALARLKASYRRRLRPRHFHDLQPEYLPTIL